MPLKIEIIVEKGESLEDYMAKLGYAPIFDSVPIDDEELAEANAIIASVAGKTQELNANGPDEPVTSPARQQRRRRTKAEMEAERAAAQTQAAAPANISTGNERVDPAAAAQDAADEAVESKPGEINHLPLREAIGRYSEKFGLPQAQEVVPLLLDGKAIIDIPLTKEAIDAAVAKIDAATASSDGRGALPAVEEGGLFGAAETPKPVEPAAPAPATRKDCEIAAMAYALKYDGQNTDVKAMPVTFEDVPKIIGGVVPGAKVFAEVPNDPMTYGKVLAAINKAIAENPFGRTAK